MSVLGRILVRLGLDSSDFKRGTQDAERQTQDFTGKLGGMFKRIAGFAVVGTVLKKAFSFGKEAYEAAAAAQGVKVAFDRLNDPNLLSGLKSATKGTVDELKLMQLSVQAKNFKLPVEQLSTYLQFATKRAQETGMSVDYLTNSIITGLGRKSVLILDNLGISAVEIREEMKKGGEMADAVGRIIQREMAKAGEVTETAAIKAERISAKWSDFKGNLGNTSSIQTAGNAIQNFLISALDTLNDLITSIGNTEVKTWLGKINTQSDIEKADSMASKLREVNAEIARLEGGAPKNWFTKGAAKVWDNVSSIFGHESDNAQLGKARNYRVSINEQIVNDELKAATDSHIGTLNIKKKTNEELRSLQKQYQGESSLLNRSAVRAAISEEQTLRSNAAAQAADQAAEAAKKIEEEHRKAQFSYKEGENSTAITQLEKQKDAYGHTLAYMEEMLRLRREQEGFAKSDADYQRIKTENDALEDQIKLRKVDYQKNSESDLKNQLSEAETEMSKLDTTTEAGAARMSDLLTVVKNLKWQIENLPQNLPTTEQGRIEKQIADLKRLQGEISIGGGSDEEIAAAQQLFNTYQKGIAELQSSLANRPTIEFADGSVAAYQQQIAKLKIGLDELTEKERAARLEKIALLEAQSTGAQVGFKNQLQQEEDRLNSYIQALALASENNRNYWQKMVDDQRKAVNEMKNEGQVLIDYSGILTSYIQSTFSSIGDYFADLSDDGQASAALERILIKPLADAAVALGSIMISMGVTALTLKSIATNPYLAIAAGAALVALGTMAGSLAQGAINKSTAGGGSSSSGSSGGNTFTGGYSNGGAYSNSAQSRANAASYSGQNNLNVTVEGELRGDTIALVMKNHAYNKGR